MTKEEFRKLAKKYLYASETPRNAFGGTKLEIFGIEKLYKKMMLHDALQQRELLIAYEKYTMGLDYEKVIPDIDEFIQAHNND